MFGRERLENSLDARRNWNDFGKLLVGKLLVGFGASSKERGDGKMGNGLLGSKMPWI